MRTTLFVLAPPEGFAGDDARAVRDVVTECARLRKERASLFGIEREPLGWLIPAEFIHDGRREDRRRCPGASVNLGIAVAVERQAERAAYAHIIEEEDERLAVLPMSSSTERVLGLYLSLQSRVISNYQENPDTAVENLQELEDEGEIYEGIDDIWPDYPSQEDFFFNEDEY